MLLEGKRLLITGVLTPQSIAFHVARVCQEEGAEVVLTSFGKAMGLTEKSARRLPQTPPVFELDANDPSHIERLEAELAGRWGALDGFLHAIAFAPPDALGGNFLDTPWDIHDPEPVAKTVAFLLSDWSKGITAEIVHVDGGYHAIGADLEPEGPDVAATTGAPGPAEPA